MRDWLAYTWPSILAGLIVSLSYSVDVTGNSTAMNVWATLLLILVVVHVVFSILFSIQIFQNPSADERDDDTYTWYMPNVYLIKRIGIPGSAVVGILTILVYGIILIDPSGSGTQRGGRRRR